MLRLFGLINGNVSVRLNTFTVLYRKNNKFHAAKHKRLMLFEENKIKNTKMLYAM